MITPTVTVIQGNAPDKLRELPDKSVHMIVSSPPYYFLRSYLPDNHALMPESMTAKRGLVIVFRVE